MSTRLLSAFIIMTLVLITGYFLFFQRSRQKVVAEPKLKETKTMIIESQAFQQNGAITSKYTCDGKNVNPPLEIKNVPQDVKSLALIVDDPDAPSGTWVHWTVWNIDPKTIEIAEHDLPDKASEGRTSFGKPGYSGPCPPSGTHRYFFKLYALDIILSLPHQADRVMLEKAMGGHILDRAELIGLYRRK